jgi:hypothetical protein
VRLKPGSATSPRKEHRSNRSVRAKFEYYTLMAIDAIGAAS